MQRLIFGAIASLFIYFPAAHANKIPMPGAAEGLFHLIDDAASTPAQVTEYLQTNVVPVDAVNANDMTPLSETIIRDREDLFRLLFEYYKHPSLNKKISAEVQSTLFEFILQSQPIGWIDYAKSQGGKIDPKTGRDEFFSVVHNKLEVVREYLRRGAKVNVHDKDGVTPLMQAANNSAEVVNELLIHSADVKTRDKNGETVVFKLLNGSFSVPILKLLVDAHADINVKNKKGRTALMSITDMLWTDDVSLPEAMIGYGADVNARDNDGENLLMTNTSPTPEYIRYMLSHHVDPNIHSKLGFTPLSLMALDASDKPEVFRALLDAKVDVNARNTSGATALMDCALSCSVEVIQTLVDAGADKCIRSENFTAVEMAIKYERPYDVQAAFSSPNCPARPHPQPPIVVIQPTCHLELIGMIWEDVCN